MSFYQQLGTYHLNSAIAASDVQSLDVIKFLHKMGVNTIEADFTGLIPLAFAIFLDNFEATKLLLELTDMSEEKDMLNRLRYYAECRGSIRVLELLDYNNK